MPPLTAPDHPPIARSIPTERNFHGDTYIDEYEWLREKENPEVLAYIAEENQYYAKTMAPLETTIESLVEEFRNRSKENDATLPVAREKWWYWKATRKDEEYPKYFRCPRSLHPQRPSSSSDLEGAPAGTELILDGNVKAAGKDFFSLLTLSISPDEKLAAIGIDNSGDEYYDLEIFEIETGQIIDRSVRGITDGIIWSQDGKYLYYTTADDAWRSYQVWQHRVPVRAPGENGSEHTTKENGENCAADTLIFQENDEQYEVEITQTSPGDYLLIHSYASLTSEVNILPLSEPAMARTEYSDSSLNKNKSDNYLHPDVNTVFPRKHGLIYSVQSNSDHFLITHNANNQDFEVAIAPVGSSTPEEWESLYRAQPGERINEVFSFRAGLAISMRAQALETVKIMPRISTGFKNKSHAPAQINCSYGKLINIETSDLAIIEPYYNFLWETDTILLQTQSLVRPPAILEVSLKDGKSQLLEQLEIPGLQIDNYVTWREWATATDGTKIPITLARRKDITPGNNPGLLHGYGAYEACIDPAYIDRWISLINRGFICGIAHIRGGGELGRGWYLEGRELNKRNSFSDFITCADHLIKNNWVDRERLAATGRSAGGLLMGAVANMGGDRFRAISTQVPFVDALTTILKPELPLTAGEWEEWGNPIIEKDVYKYMKSYSPYENVTSKEYPALMITTSYNDIRVFYVEPTKWVAKLRKQAINGKDRPIIYHCEMVAGHAGKSGRYNRWRAQAAELAFILDQLGCTL